ncbi:Aryl-phospho-beta-D-glucosidase BglC, GH1 family [Rhizobium sp. NFR03]|nr:Aryl-phospho-beta-D-glucosidase BglC, GH1 family [Rhizobium sp. NFR03]
MQFGPSSYPEVSPGLSAERMGPFSGAASMTGEAQLPAIGTPRNDAWRRMLAVILALFVALSPLVAPVATASDTRPAFRVEKGVNVFPFLWTPTARKNGRFLGAGYVPVESYFPLSNFSSIKAMGFDHVRLPVNVGPLVLANADELQARADYVFAQVDAISALGLKVLVDIHTPDKGRNSPYDARSLVEEPGMFDALKRVVAAFAERTASRPADRVALELFNEPQVECRTPGLWEGYLKTLVSVARHSAPNHTLIVTGSCGGGLFGLLRLDPSGFDDPNILYSLHYYSPPEFIFQGYAPVTQDLASRYPPVFRWPANAEGASESIAAFGQHVAELWSEPSSWGHLLSQLWKISVYYYRGYDAGDVVQDFDKAIAWAERYDIPPTRLYLGEFGAPRPKPGLLPEYNADRLAWLSVVRKQAEARGIPWAYWCYGSYFGLFDEVSGQQDADMLVSLGLNHP